MTAQSDSWATNGQTSIVGSFDVPVSSISVSGYIYGLGTDDRTIYSWATNGQTSIVGSFDVPVSSISVSGYFYGLGTDDRTIYSWATNGQTSIVGSFDVPVSSISVSGFIYGLEAPEPSTLTLLGTGAMGLLGYAWRKRRTRKTKPTEKQKTLLGHSCPSLHIRPTNRTCHDGQLDHGSGCGKWSESHRLPLILPACRIPALLLAAGSEVQYRP